MAVGNSSFPPRDVQITYANSHKVSNPILATANTEYTIPLVANCKQLILKSRTIAKLQLSFISGDSNLKFITIYPGASLSLTEINFVSENIYVQSNKNSTTLELLELF